LKRSVIAVFLFLMLVPYAIFSFYVLTAPVSEEDYFTNSTTHANCSPYAPSSRTLQVSQQGRGQFTSISSAVLAAAPGDIIMVHEGIYHEAISIAKSCLTVVGTDRRGVILDGGRSLANGVAVSRAQGVTIANLTTRDYTYNGVYYEESNDWTIRGVNSINNARYGIYTVASSYGVMADDFTMGNGDSGFYIGEVPDCRCVIVNSTAYGNVLGYSGTRANGVTIRNSRFINNSVGIGPNTLLPDMSVLLSGNWKLPLFATNHTIVDSVVENNNNATVKGVGISQTYGVPIGTGISMIGTSMSKISNNTVSGNRLWGIAEFTFFNLPTGNTYSSNRFFKNGQDFFTDGTGFFGCSTGETATGNPPPDCASPAWLRVTLPNPFDELVLLESVGRPGITGDLVVAFPFILLAASAGAGKMEGPSRARRVGSALVDLLVAGDLYLLAVSVLVVFGFGASSPADVAALVTSISFLLPPLAYLLLVTSWFFYGLVSETVKRRTVGQWLLGMRVTSKTGGRTRFSRILLRNLLLYVDTLFFGTVGLLSIMVKRRTIGELLSGTSLKEYPTQGVVSQ